MNDQAGKGDRLRPFDRKRYAEGWQRVFGGRQMGDKIRFPVSDNIWNMWEPGYWVRDHVLVDAEGDPVSPAITNDLLDFICHILNRCDIDYNEAEDQRYLVLDMYGPEENK